MITHFFSRQWCLAVAIGLVLPGLKSPAWTYAGEAEETVEKLVQKLGAGDYDAREKAQKELMSRGVDALEPLLASLNSDDPEAAWRIVELLERISLQTRDPDKVQRVVERLMNVTGQLRREFAIRGTSLQPKIDSFKSLDCSYSNKKEKYLPLHGKSLEQLFFAEMHATIQTLKDRKLPIRTLL